jgi:hypothetical protein
MVQSPSQGANTSSASHRLPHILWNPNVYYNNNNNNNAGTRDRGTINNKTE